MTETTRTERQAKVEGHGGALAVAVARRRGVSAMFTLSGAHVFPLYDGAVKADPPLPLIDVRHEQTAVFAAEGLAKLTRVPGLAVVTAGPGVTNSVSAVTTAWFNGSPLLVLGGRAPQTRWPGSPPCWAGRNGPCWCSARTCGPTTPSRRPAGPPRRSASR